MPELAPKGHHMIFWLSLVVRVSVRANGGYVCANDTITLISEEGVIMSLVLPTYVADILQGGFFRRDIFRWDQYFMSTFHIQIVDISSPFWLNDEISEISRYF